MNKLLAIGAIAFALIFTTTDSRAASEEILNFESRIQIHGDATLTVTETIQVRATGNRIKRGILRDFPTIRKNKSGNKTLTGFEVLGVRRNNQTINYWLEKSSESQRVYMGNRDKNITPGIYTFELIYKTDNQIGFFPEFDEIYWNVTGNKWSFPILQAHAVVQLPAGARVLQQYGYTGPTGANDQNYTNTIASDGSPRFSTTTPLSPGEGLTVAVAWPKGFVNQPEPSGIESAMDRIGGEVGVAVLGLLIVFGYYMAVWMKVGRDPVSRAVIPLFEPPKELAPAASHSVLNMGFSNKAFSAAVVSLAVKGALTIEDRDGTYVLKKKPWLPKNLSVGEGAMLETFFSSKNELLLHTDNHEIIGAALGRLEQKLAAELEGVVYRSNRKYLLWGTGLTLANVSGLFFLTSLADAGLVLALGAALWSFICTNISLKAVAVWKRTGKLGKILGQVIALSLVIAFGINIFAHFKDVVPIPIMIALLLTFVLTPLFRFLLKAPTLKGQRLKDQVEGFKLYLSVAEKDLMNFKHPPEKTPERFEAYLPYALALGVGHLWCQKFSDTLQNASVTGKQGYHPDWYSGSDWDVGNPTRLGDKLENAFSDALTSSSTAPNSGSSAGSGGGGFSGGGGGGGGGGGF